MVTEKMWCVSFCDWELHRVRIPFRQPPPDCARFFSQPDECLEFVFQGLWAVRQPFAWKTPSMQTALNAK